MRSTVALSVFLSIVAASEGKADDDLSKFVERHCLDCHTGRDAEADFRLDTLQADFGATASFEEWSMVHRRIEKGEMPPTDSDQPEFRQKTEFLKTLAQKLGDIDRQRQAEFGRSELRRLSRAEYANSLKDILVLPHLELEEMLPPDSLAHGYQKSASALDFSHVMLSRYLDVADYALWKALVREAKSRPSEVVRAELKSVDGVTDTLQTLRVQLKQTTAIPLVGMERDPTLEVHRGNFQKREPGYVRDPEPHFDGVATFMNSRSNHNITVKPFKVLQSGYYKLRVHGWGLLNDHGKLLPSDRTETVAFYTKSGRLLGRCDLPPNQPTTSEVTVWLEESEPIEFLAISTDNEQFNFPHPKSGTKFETFKAYGVGLHWLEMEGPLVESWPPESHRSLLGDLKLEATNEQPNGLHYRVISDDPIDDARRLLGRFLRRAYRRPQQEGDLTIPMRMVRQRLQRNEPFVDALMAGYRAILTSPDFILLQEQPGQLDAHALANRLSFFLLNSPPDRILRQVADRGELLNNEELRSQTNRLLDHPKSSRFVKHFLDYWLDLRNITLTEPDGNLYPEYNALLAESMIEETQAFFSEMLRSDLTAATVFDSDFLMINQRMAQLYGIAGVQGSETRKVAIPEDSQRGGLLTQGSLLKITANGTTTSPVVRGTFVMSRLLGDPPPPPPSSVPAVEPDITGATTIRQQLAKHRNDQLCASCHKKIDPPGFALESFDVMGGLRTAYRALAENSRKAVNLKSNGKPVRYQIGLKVDSAGQLSDGSEFHDLNEFRNLLELRTPQVARNLLEQFIVYSTGAPVGFGDRETVDGMMKSLADQNYGVRSMIHEVVQSDLFRKK